MHGSRVYGTTQMGITSHSHFTLENRNGSWRIELSKIDFFP